MYLAQAMPLIPIYPTRSEYTKGKRCRLYDWKSGRNKGCVISTLKCNEYSIFFQKTVSLCITCFEEFHTIQISLWRKGDKEKETDREKGTNAIPTCIRKSLFI